MDKQLILFAIIIILNDYQLVVFFYCGSSLSLKHTRCSTILLYVTIKFKMLFLVPGVGIEQYILNFLVEQHNKMCKESKCD